MARTKASVGAKVSSGKSQKARCSTAPVSVHAGGAGGGAGGGGGGGGGGNPVCPRDTPRWQRAITTFFTPQLASSSSASSSSASSDSSASSGATADSAGGSGVPREGEGEEGAALRPLRGEHCRKVHEYFPPGGKGGRGKGKGVGKKTRPRRDKENLALNALASERDDTAARKRERDHTGDDSLSKRLKL